MSPAPAPTQQPQDEEARNLRDTIAMMQLNLDSTLAELAQLRQFVDAEGLLRGWRNK